MLVSVNWLSQYIDLSDIDPKDLKTNCGLINIAYHVGNEYLFHAPAARG